MDRWKRCRDGRAKSSHRRCPSMLHARRLAAHVALSTAARHPAARRRAGDAPCRHAPHRAIPGRDARQLGLAGGVARRGAGLRPARDALRPRPSRHRHRGGGGIGRGRTAGRRRAVRGPGRGSPSRVDRPRRRAGVELRARGAARRGGRDSRAGPADRGAAGRPRARLVAAAPGRAARRSLHRSALTAGRRAARAAAPRRAEGRPGGAQR